MYNFFILQIQENQGHRQDDQGNRKLKTDSASSSETNQTDATPVTSDSVPSTSDSSLPSTSDYVRLASDSTPLTSKPKNLKGNKKKTPAMLLLEEFLNASTDILKTSLESAADDPFFLIREPGKSSALLTSRLVPLSKTDNGKKFIESFLSITWYSQG